MNKLIAGTVMGLSAIIVVGGHWYYQQKLDAIAEHAHSEELLAVGYQQHEAEADASEAEPDDVHESSASEAEEADTEERDIDLDGLLPQLADAVRNAQDNEDSLTVAVYASETMLNVEGEGQSWPERLDEMFSEAFADINYEIAVFSSGDYNTVELIQSNDYNRVTEDEWDMVIMETMLWNDNGQVAITQSNEHLTIMRDAFASAGSDVLTLLSPPAYNTVNYPAQIQDFQTYASEQNWQLIDHWSYWPEMTDQALLDYVGEESRYMTEEGHAVVSNELAGVLGLLEE